MQTLTKTFQLFDINYPEKSNRLPLNSISEQLLDGKIPIELLNLLKEEGTFTFANGLFFLTDPIELKSIAKYWNLDPEKNFIFLRTAFGDFFYWDGTKVNVVHVNTAVISPLVADITDFFNFSLTDEYYKKKTLFGSYLDKAKENLGELHSNQCYGFILPLFLGGNNSLKNLHRIKLNDCLSILAHLQI